MKSWPYPRAAVHGAGGSENSRRGATDRAVPPAVATSRPVKHRPIDPGRDSREHDGAAGRSRPEEVGSQQRVSAAAAADSGAADDLAENG